MTSLLIRRLERRKFGWIRRSLTLGLALVATTAALDAPAAWASEGAKDCPLKQYASLPVTWYQGWPQIPVVIDGHPVLMTLDIGSALSIIASDAVQKLGLKVTQLVRAPVVSFGGERIDSYATLPDIALGNARLRDIHVLTPRPHASSSGDESTVDGHAVGRIGMDVLSGVDVELDLGHDKVNLFSSQHCRNGVVYWADRYDVLPMRQNSIPT